MLDIRRYLADLTATSALPLGRGKWPEDMQCRTPQRWRKTSVHPAVTSGPPSLDSSSSTPNVVKKERRWRMRPAAPARVVPTGDPKTVTQPEGDHRPRGNCRHLR